MNSITSTNNTSTTSTSSGVDPSVPAMNSSVGYSDPVKQDFLLSTLFTLNIIAIIFTVGLFGWKYYLNTQIEQKKLNLGAYSTKLENVPIEKMKNVSDLLKAAAGVVEGYPFASGVFSLIEDSVENKVYFTELTANLAGDKSGVYVVEVYGVGDSYRAVIQQMTALRSEKYSPYISSVILDPGFSLDESTGEIKFKVTMRMRLSGVTEDALATSFSSQVRKKSPPVYENSLVATSSVLTEINTSTSSNLIPENIQP